MNKPREIIDDYAKEIALRKTRGTVPSRGVINFRNEKAKGIEREIVDIPISLLRYRKDNGRITSDVISYERVHLEQLDETKEETQQILFEFLKKNDPEKTEILKKSIKKDGQTDPAIITCDGFLINGNRRRMVLDILRQEEPTKYNTMRVIILPGKEAEGGPPTIKEIELLENRYQLQQDGKSEYTGLNRALSIRRKIECGISLEEQLQDDPACSEMTVTSKEFKNKIKDFQKEFLLPLERVDTYLEIIGRPGHYDSIEGRWQAFIDFSIFYNGKLQDRAWQLKSGITDNDIGTVQDIAFNIIRKRSIKGRSVKLHEIIRKIPNFLMNEDARNAVFDLSDSIDSLIDKERFTPNGKEYSFEEQDLIWSKKNDTLFAKCINNAYSFLEMQKEDESALTLIKNVNKKLTHSNMDINKIPKSRLGEFVKEAELVIERTTDLKSEAWQKMRDS